MAGELVSIIMPAYNAGNYIAASIQSVLAQTYPDWELIVVDDGSTDNTANVIQQFVRRDGRVKYIFQENGRLGKARNTGIMNSGGPLIAFLDSDDLWVETKLEKQTQAMVEQDVDVVFSDCYIFRDQNTADETTTFKSLVGRFAGPDILDLLIRQNRIPVLTILLKRTALQRVGWFDEPITGCEDYDLWLRLAKANADFYGMADVLARYRRHDAAMTAVASNLWKPMLEIVRRHIHDTRLSESEKNRRITGLYRELIASLIDEGKIAEAKQFVQELYAFNQASLVTRLQKLLINIWPGQYNFISRECLYRTEWHLQNGFSRGKNAN